MVQSGFNAEVRTGTSGQFAFANVPMGLVQICAPESGDYFDPCFWDASANLIDYEGQATLDAPPRKSERRSARKCR